MAPPVIRRIVRTLGIGAVVGAVVGVVRAVRPKPPPPVTGTARWQPLRPEEAPAPRTGPVHFTATAAEDTAPATWVAPVDGACPVSHPIKGNEDSGIYHVPGGMSYERTIPERCYATPDAAEADGFRPAKR